MKLRAGVIGLGRVDVSVEVPPFVHPVREQLKHVWTLVLHSHDKVRLALFEFNARRVDALAEVRA